MNLRLKPYGLLLTTFVCFATTFIVDTAAAAVDGDAGTADEYTGLVEDLRDHGPLVEQHMPIDADLPYKYRRGTHAFNFGLTYENFFPESYVSIANFTNPYTDFFGESEIPMMGLEFGYKYNFVLGALNLGAGGGYGTISEDPQLPGEVFHKVSFTKYHAYLGYVMDNIFDEPYVAPYINFGTTIFHIDEKNDTKEYSGSTQTGFYYKVGALIQLNWLEDDTRRTGLIDFGLQNTYLDLFAIQYMTSIAEDDPDLETSINFGAGLRLEF